VQIIDKHLKLAIKDEIPKFADSASQIIIEDEYDGGNVGDQIRRQIGKSKDRGSVILIMGGIGSGKSTFCKRFF
jgi:archaellum biogenesis ATPase FlaH